MISEGRDALLFGAAVRNVFAGHHSFDAAMDAFARIIAGTLSPLDFVSATATLTAT